MPKEVNSLKTAKDIVDIDSRLQQVLRDEMDALKGGGYSSRQSERLALHARFSKAIREDGQNIYKAKSANQSTEDYIAKAFLGGQYSDAITKNRNNKPNSMTKWLNRSKLEKVMTMGDSQVAAYFLSSIDDSVKIYDEIDSLCAYMYQVEEAVFTYRDNILNAEQPGESLNCDIRFPNIAETSSVEEYVGTIKGLFKYQDFDKKLRDHITVKMIKYGIYYLMIIPYTDIWIRLNQMDSESMIRGAGGSRWIFESADPNIENDATESIMESVTQILEIADTDSNGNIPNYHGKNVPIHVKEQLDVIRENIEDISVCENNLPPDDIIGVSIDKLTKNGKQMDKTTVDTIIHAFRHQAEESTKKLEKLIGKDNISSKRDIKNKGYVSDGISASEMAELPGCYLKLVDPRCMIPAQVFDYTIGYYYFENYDYARIGTSLTDALSNQMNFNQRNMIMDNIVNSVLKNLKYKDLIEGDQQLRNMILNCVLYAERRNNPIRIKFIQADYVVPFQTNTNEDGRGQPILLRSLFYGHLYTSLLLFNISAIITKSTDSEFYYLRDSAILPQYANRVADVMDQLEDNNIDPISIANGNILHGMKGINKRYFMNMGTSNEKPIEVDVVSGQAIDIHTDLMTELRKMTISSTGCPSLMADFVDEVQYASMIGMENIKVLTRANTISRDMDPSVTLAIKKIAKFTNVSIPENILDAMEIELRKSKVIKNSYDNSQLNDVINVANSVVDVWSATSQNSQSNEDIDNLKALMAKELIVRQTPSIPWEVLPSIEEACIAKMKAKSLQQKIIDSTTSES